MRHDYQLPQNWEEMAERGELARWFTQERCRRMAMRQDTTTGKALRAARRRAQRRHEAVGYVDVEEKR